jgi:nitrate ABC transporter ATP-binding subunit
MALELENLRKTFKTKSGVQDVLRGVDLSIAKGEFVSVIGHSGCGKSTLLSMIGGLTPPDSGSVVLDGQPVTGPGPDRAIVFQHYSLLPWLSVYRNVYEAAICSRPDRSKGEAAEATERYLRSTGLWEHRDKRPGEISGGMRQRTAVARAFAVSPKVLLLDEPFGALDALTRAHLQNQLIELWSDESETETVVMVTHGIDEAIFLADRIVVMANPPLPSIAEVIAVEIPRPRDKAQIASDPRYLAVYQRLVHLLQHELAPSEDAGATLAA